MSCEEPLRACLAAWAPFHAGAEVAAERLAIGLRDAGHQVTILLGTQGETCRRMRDADLDVYVAPLVLTDKFRWWQFKRAQGAVRRILREVQPDVIHANDLPTSQMIGQAAGRLGIPRLCHHRWIFDGAAIEWMCKFGAERHTFVSRSLMSELCRASPRLAASPGSVIYDGLPLPPPPKESDRRRSRQQLNLPVDRELVLFAGQIIPRKGVADLLHAWMEMPAARRSRAELVIVGDDLENAGQHRRLMEALAVSLGCPARFVGFQRNISDWITAADVCVVPSHAEPLGNATLEAMAHGRPVVGSRVGGIPEMIVHESTGLLAPPSQPGELAAAIGLLLEQPSVRERLGIAARRRCEELFSLEAHVEAMVGVYRMLISQRDAIVV